MLPIDSSKKFVGVTRKWRPWRVAFLLRNQHLLLVPCHYRPMCKACPVCPVHLPETASGKKATLLKDLPHSFRFSIGIICCFHSTCRVKLLLNFPGPMSVMTQVFQRHVMLPSVDRLVHHRFLKVWLKLKLLCGISWRRWDHGDVFE